MGLYTKIDLYGFADYYHRFATTGLTLDEMFLNWKKYTENPRDVNDIVNLPKKLKKEIASVKPPATTLWSVLKTACKIHGVSRERVNGKSQKRELSIVRQQVCFVAIELGFQHSDIPTILKWDRSQTYHRVKQCKELAISTKEFRWKLNQLLKAFGLDNFVS